MRLLTERFEHHSGKEEVLATLGGCNCKDESTDKKHDDRIRKAVQQRLVTCKCPKSLRLSISEEDQSTVRCSEQKQDDNHDRGCPRRDGFEKPHKSCKKENCQCPLLDYCHTGNPVLHWQTPYCQRHYNSDDNLDCPFDKLLVIYPVSFLPFVV